MSKHFSIIRGVSGSFIQRELLPLRVKLWVSKPPLVVFGPRGPIFSDEMRRVFGDAFVANYQPIELKIWLRGPDKESAARKRLDDVIDRLVEQFAPKRVKLWLRRSR